MIRVAKRRIVLGCMVCVIGICLNACGIFKIKPAAEVLTERVSGLMDAKISNDWGKVYDFYDPSYKAKKPKDAFVGINRQSQIIKYEIESIEIAPSEDTATVKVKYTAKAMGFEFNGIINTQTWMKRGWTWYLQVNEDSSSKPF